MNRKPVVIPGSSQHWRMQTLGPNGILLDVIVTIDWADIQRLARALHALEDPTRRPAGGASD